MNLKLAFTTFTILCSLIAVTNAAQNDLNFLESALPTKNPQKLNACVEPNSSNARTNRRFIIPSDSSNAIAGQKIYELRITHYLRSD